MTATPSTTSRGWIRFLVLAGLMLLLGSGALVWQRYYSTYHLATVQPGALYRDGARSVDELQRAVEKVHAKTVVCLVDDKELADPAKPQFAAEMAWLKQQGIRAERIPVKLGGWPTTSDVQRFLEVAGDKANQPVLVHCAQGVRRTAMMVAAYQESLLGYDRQKAKDAILTFGHSDRTVNDIHKFIDEYNPTSRTVSSSLASVEMKGVEK